MEKVLITGFEPFGGEPINPAQEVTKLLDGKIIAGHQVIARGLPVVRHTSRELLSKMIDEINPVLFIAVGQAGGRLEMSLERVAINVDDFRIPDNSNLQTIDEPIIPEGPVGYWSTLPIKAALVAMRAAGIPTSVSNTAGTYVCNHLFYGLMHHLAITNSKARGGFVHIPYLPEQAARLTTQPSMSLSTMASGLEVLIETCLSVDEDTKVSGGTIC